MLYYLFTYLDQQFDLAGAGVFQFLTFRAAAAILIALVISMLFGGKLIKYLQRKQVKDEVRKLGLAGEEQKQGTPTMGGVIIILAILVPTLLLAKVDNIYIMLMLILTIWLAVMGFVDDYIKVFKKDKGGLKAKTKLIGQFGVGLIVASTLYFHDDVVIRKDMTTENLPASYEVIDSFTKVDEDGTHRVLADCKATVTTIPFLKDQEFNYSWLLWFMGDKASFWGFLIYVPIITLIIVFISNGANLTDGIDGLATGTSAIIGITLGIFAYISGNAIISDYLNIMHLPNIGEMVIFLAAFIGACIGFLWYNAYPAQVFMGDTGSLPLGGIIASSAIIIRKELLLPILCGIFIIENLSVMIQVAYFKYTKKKYGEGRRIFLMSPLHHHFQKKGINESKITTRFWIVGILLAVLTFVTIKLR